VLEIRFSSFDYFSSLWSKEALLRTSPADMPLQRTLSFSSLPFKSSVRCLESALMARTPNVVVYHISDPHKFFYPILCLWTVRAPSSFAFIHARPGYLYDLQSESFTLSLIGYPLGSSRRAWPRLRRYGLRLENLVSGIFKNSKNQRGETQ
jgi:hypothetical protein